jgi:hypothetical protein
MRPNLRSASEPLPARRLEEVQMAVIGRERLVHQQSGRRGAPAPDAGPQLARTIEITVLGWVMSLLAVSFERFLASRGKRERHGIDP